MRRLMPVLLVAALATAAVGFRGSAGASADYFRVLAAVFLVLFVCAVAGRRKWAASLPGG